MWRWSIVVYEKGLAGAACVCVWGCESWGSLHSKMCVFSRKVAAVCRFWAVWRWEQSGWLCLWIGPLEEWIGEILGSIQGQCFSINSGWVWMIVVMWCVLLSVSAAVMCAWCAVTLLDAWACSLWLKALWALCHSGKPMTLRPGSQPSPIGTHSSSTQVTVYHTHILSPLPPLLFLWLSACLDLLSLCLWLSHCIVLINLPSHSSLSVLHSYIKVDANKREYGGVQQLSPW